jgi:ribonuclease HII
MPHLEHENQLGYPAIQLAGVDEVGRGCIAGPVVAGAVVLPRFINFKAHAWLEEIDDSKKLSATQRARLAPLIFGWALSVGVGVASVQEIDELNIFHASHLAMIRAVEALKVRPQALLVDGKFLPKQGFSVPATALIQGDQKSLSIAAASIVAKVWRDEYMVAMDSQYPVYGFLKHKGYPTPDHAQALKKHGVSEIHRRSFKTVAVLL